MKQNNESEEWWKEKYLYNLKQQLGKELRPYDDRRRIIMDFVASAGDLITQSLFEKYKDHNFIDVVDEWLKEEESQKGT